MTEILNLRDRKAADWSICARCRSFLYGKRLKRNLLVCPECGHHHPLSAPERIDLLLDPAGRELLPVPATRPDPLTFTDTRPYAERLEEAARRSDLPEAVVCVRGTVDDRPVIVAAMDFRFLGGSLGTAAGEMITQAAEAALRERTPLLIVTASGGARMQEGVLSLMQMAKTSQALAELDTAGIMTICLVTDPTYGGVWASFATLTDIIVAEPAARAGFAGPRVIQQTTGRSLPQGFQTAEFLLEHGQIDAIVTRPEQRTVLARLLSAAHSTRRLPYPPSEEVLIRDPGRLPSRPAWERVLLARHIERPTFLDHADQLLDQFVELHGDRLYGDCPAMVGGIGQLDGVPVMAIGTQKGHNPKELMHRNFGMATPEGYRKSARLLRLAAKLRLPVITLIDTPGAHPGTDAEERGQALAIADNIRLLSGLPVPVIAVITGEGGSGGALALAVADRVIASANAIYSVISPEGCAAILWKNQEAGPQAAEALAIDPPALLRHSVIDAVLPEPGPGAHADPLHAGEMLKDALRSLLHELRTSSEFDLVGARRRRFRAFGASLTQEAGA
jgi:acyl-CoA carboxylase subunit beta